MLTDELKDFFLLSQILCKKWDWQWCQLIQLVPMEIFKIQAGAEPTDIYQALMKKKSKSIQSSMSFIFNIITKFLFNNKIRQMSSIYINIYYCLCAIKSLCATPCFTSNHSSFVLTQVWHSKMACYNINVNFLTTL